MKPSGSDLGRCSGDEQPAILVSQPQILDTVAGRLAGEVVERSTAQRQDYDLEGRTAAGQVM